MSDNPNCTIYIGNLDEKVTERILYDILIQAGRVVDLHIPKDKESEKPKGFAFAEYETEEIAEYAVRLFSGLVTLYNRTLKFASANKQTPGKERTATTPTSNSSQRQRPYTASVPITNSENFQHPTRLSVPDRFSDHTTSYSQVLPHRISDQPSGYGSHYSGNNHEYSRRAFGAAVESINRSGPHHPDRTSPISYPTYSTDRRD